MTKQEVVKVLTVLQAAYPMFYRGQSEEQTRNTAQLWQMMFEDKPYEVVMTAVKSLIATRTETYPPNIGSVNEMIQKITAPQMNPLEAWGYVRKALENGAYGSQEEWERLPEPVRNTITPEQIRAWATDDEYNESVVSSNFMRNFQARQKDDREVKMMPEPVQNMVQIAMQKMNERKEIAEKVARDEPKRLAPAEHEEGGNTSLRARLEACRKEQP